MMKYKTRQVLSSGLMIVLLQIQCFYFNEISATISVPSSSSSSGRDNALIEIVLYENNQIEGGYTTYDHRLSGRFTSIGLNTGAEGDVSQVKNRFPCDSQSNDPFDKAGKKYGWVAFIVVDETTSQQTEQCSSLTEKAKTAIARGATAVIFDVTRAPQRANELNRVKPILYRPVLIVSGNDAIKMSDLLLWKGLRARARIHQTFNAYEVKTNSNEYFDMGIFMAFFVLVALICIGMLLKIKYRQRQKQTSLTRMALQAIARMETRKFTNSQRSPSSSGRGSTNDFPSSQWPPFDIHACAICLEEFSEGQDIRIVPCRHEFHTQCVDPWLLSNCTCPLCMLSIVEPLEENKQKNTSTHLPRLVARLRQYIPWLDQRNPILVDPNLANRRSLMIGDVQSLHSLQSVRTLDRDETAQGLDELHETTTEVRPNHHRLHFCRHHRKKYSKDSSQRSLTGSLLSDHHSDVDHTIVVVATFAQERFDELQEDVV